MNTYCVEAPDGTCLGYFHTCCETMAEVLALASLGFQPQCWPSLRVTEVR
jgi:hypothetical protein